MGSVHKIHVMSYLPTEKDLKINQLVSYMDPPYCHTELVFEDGQASSIYAGETVFMHKRKYSNPNYKIITLEVSEKDYYAAYAHCKYAMENGVSFSRLAMYAAFLPWQVVPSNNKYTFCSHLVTQALIKANVCELEGCNPMTMSPSKLHKALEASGRNNMIDTVLTRYSRIK